MFHWKLLDEAMKKATLMVETTEFKDKMRASAHGREPLAQVADVLRGYVKRGLSRKHATKVLEELRREVDEDTEDRILEILDLVSGYCSAGLRIWED